MAEKRDSGSHAARQNLREALIAGFEAGAEKPAAPRLRRGPGARTLRSIRQVHIVGAETFFVGIFAGLAAGTAIGYGIVGIVDAVLTAIHQTLPGLFPRMPIDPSLYLLATFFGGALGLVAGFIWLAPWLETRRHPSGWIRDVPDQL
jgi:hypothetical protein